MNQIEWNWLKFSVEKINNYKEEYLYEYNKIVVDWV